MQQTTRQALRRLLVEAFDHPDLEGYLAIRGEEALAVGMEAESRQTPVWMAEAPRTQSSSSRPL